MKVINKILAVAFVLSLGCEVNAMITMDVYTNNLLNKLKVAPGEIIPQAVSDLVDEMLKKPENCQSPQFVWAIVKTAEDAFLNYQDQEICLAGFRLFEILLEGQYQPAYAAAQAVADRAMREGNAFWRDRGENLQEAIRSYKRRNNLQ